MPEQANDAIEIGSPRDTQELDAMLALMCEAFEMPFGAARDVFYSDPYFDPQNKLVLRVGGRVVSCLTLTRTRCWIGEGIAELAGIAGVATLAAERRKGYAGALLNHAIQLLQQGDVALAGLLPYDLDYYRRFGFEQVGHATRQTVSREQIPAFAERARVRPFQEEDLPAIEALWNDLSRGATLHCLRDAKRWRSLLQGGRQAVVYESDEEKIGGYLLYNVRPGSMISIRPQEITPPTLCVQEVVGRQASARRGLFGWISDQTQVGSVEFQQDFNPSSLEEKIGFVLKGRSNTDVLLTVERLSGPMFRLIRLERCLNALADDWRNSVAWARQRNLPVFWRYSDWRGTLLCVMHDPLKPGGSEQVIITGGEDDLLHIRAAREGETFTETVSGEAGVWSQVVTGHLSGMDACALGLLQASTPLAAKWAGSLFGKRFPFLPIPDYF